MNMLLLLLAGLAATAAAVWAWRDYRKWKALGPGGLPYNPWGWLITSAMKLLASDPLKPDRFTPLIGAADDGSYLGELPARPGPRPRIGSHPIPHRQLDQLVDRAMQEKIARVFAETVARRADLVQFRLSYFELRNEAVFLCQPDCGHTHARFSRGEIAHIHPSDGSMHMTFSPSDSAKVVAAGWGEPHALSGVSLESIRMKSLPPTYLLIYPPRNDGELAVTARLLEASIAHMALLPDTTRKIPRCVRVA